MNVIDRLLTLYHEVDRRTTRIGKPSWEDIAYVRTALHEILRSLPAEPAGDDVAITENRRAAAGLREHLHRMMLATPTTDERDTFKDGYAAGLADALEALDRIDWREISPVDATDATSSSLDPVVAEATDAAWRAVEGARAKAGPERNCWCVVNGYVGTNRCGYCPFRGLSVPA